jgi:hypothetical protein
VEVVSALDVASAILVVAKFSAELLSTSIKSEKDSSLVQIGEYLENSPDRIRTLRDDLSTINGHTVSRPEWAVGIIWGVYWYNSKE